MGLELWHLKSKPTSHPSLASCPQLDTVSQLRSFIGAFKVLSRVIPGCSTFLTKFDDAIAGRESKERSKWTDELHASFHNPQASLSTAHTLTLPKAADQLWIVTDGAVRDPGIGSTLYVTRDGKLHLTGSLMPNYEAHSQGGSRAR